MIDLDAIRKRQNARLQVSATANDEREVDIADLLEALCAEVNRLAHLHHLDHKLADRWQAENEKLRALLGRVGGYGTDCGWVALGHDEPAAGERARAFEAEVAEALKR